LSIDLVSGGSGSDTVDYSTTSVFLEISLSAAGNATVSLGGTPFDTLFSIENLTGGSGNDVLYGNDGSAVANVLRGGKGSDSLNGQQGNDTLQGGMGYDYLMGGTGADFADYSDRSLAVSVTLIAGATVHARVNGIVEDELVSIENLRGGGGRDRFIGSTGANILDGGAGNDLLAGRAGNDTLYGGAGNDSLTGETGNDRLYGGTGSDLMTGGAGSDHFVFDSPLVPANRDRITDFNHVYDTIRLENSIFKGMGSGPLKSVYFYKGTKAHDADDHIIYNSGTGALYYDSDGIGPRAQIHFATLTNHPSNVASNDFLLI
jgi:Ca2+-binding RTX toxin-like protein